MSIGRTAADADPVEIMIAMRSIVGSTERKNEIGTVIVTEIIDAVD